MIPHLQSAPLCVLAWMLLVVLYLTLSIACSASITINDATASVHDYDRPNRITETPASEHTSS